jgi:hypothetical protein
MTYTRKQYRLGSTAIAAVIALSSTPLAAQEVPSTEISPVEATTTAPEPIAPAADPLAPAAQPEVTTAPAETATTTTEAEAAPATKKVAKKTATKPVRTVQRTAPKAAQAAAPVAAPAAEPAMEAPVPAPAPVAAVGPVPEAAPVSEPQPAKDAELKEALPIAGGAGAVILALAGAGMAVRRKRRKEDEEFEHHWLDNDELVLADAVDSEPQPESSWDPPVRTPVAVPMPAAMEPTGVPDSFDTSDFGRHVKAAYEGPTPENPSLSLRKRLKIAGELDRRERLGLSAKPVEATKPVNAATPEKMAFSFGGTATPAKVDEYQF